MCLKRNGVMAGNENLWGTSPFYRLMLGPPHGVEWGQVPGK